MIGAIINQRVIREIRCNLYAHIQKLSHSFFERNRTGSLTSRIISNVQTISPFLGRTLIQLWMNIHAGRITIDGRDIKDYRITSLRGHIGLVPQEPILFSGSVLDNILYGRPDASIDDVYASLNQAHALEFVNRLPEELDSRIGEDGASLSGCQRQRIAIARAFL